jgi:hypothetical protein
MRPANRTKAQGDTAGRELNKDGQVNTLFKPVLERIFTLGL